MCKITKEFDDCYEQAIEEGGEDFDRAIEIFLEKHPEMDESELMQRLIAEESNVADYYAKLADERLIQEFIKEGALKNDE